MLVLVAAADRELRPWLERRAERDGHRPLGQLKPGTIQQIPDTDDPIAVLCTGVGLESTRRALQLLEESHPRLVRHVGFAGGLRAGINAGDVLVVTAVSDQVHDPDSGKPPPPPRALPTHLVTPLRSSLAELPDRMAQGALLTVSRFIDSAQQKRQLGLDSGYLACEMEAALVREAAEALGATYAGIRGISDSEDRDVPPKPPGLTGPDRLQRSLHYLRKPGSVLGAARMIRGSRRAAEALGRAIPRALDVLQVFSQP
ncbi:MAG: hypothetical protein VX498_14445 [Myxococcota bacterium]|nr:hypothetical protein [Myxococcota bacterium]